MRVLGSFLVIVGGSLAVSGCTETAGSVAADNTRAAEEVCLAAVSKRTNNSDVTVVRSHFDEAVTSVTVGVGAERTPWRCVAVNNGSQQIIQSIIRE